MRELKEAASKAHAEYLAALDAWRWQKNATTKAARDAAFAAMQDARNALEQARAA